MSNLIHVMRLQAYVGAVQRALDVARLCGVVGAQPRRPLAPCQHVVDHAQAWLRSFGFGQKDACNRRRLLCNSPHACKRKPAYSGCHKLKTASAGQCLSWKHTLQGVVGPCICTCAVCIRKGLFSCGGCFGPRLAGSRSRRGIRLARCVAPCAARHGNTLTVGTAARASCTASHLIRAVSHRCTAFMKRAAHVPCASSACCQRRGHYFRSNLSSHLQIQSGCRSTQPQCRRAKSLFRMVGILVLLARALTPFDRQTHGAPEGMCIDATSVTHMSPNCLLARRVKDVAALDASSLRLRQVAV